MRSCHWERMCSMIIPFKRITRQSICEKYNISMHAFQNILTDYQSKLKQQRLNNKKISRTNRKFSDDQIEWIRYKVKSLSGSHFTLNDLRDLILEQYPEVKSISLSCLSKLMKNNLKYSFRKLSSQNIKMKSIPKFKEMLNSAALDLSIIKENPSTVFFDEFSIQPKSQKWYGWAPKGQPHVIWKYVESFWMSFIICFTGTGKVAIKGNKSGTISEMIAVFIDEIIDNFFENSDSTN